MKNINIALSAVVSIGLATNVAMADDIDMGAQQQAIQNQDQIIQQGTSGIQTATGSDQYINQGMSNTSVNNLNRNSAQQYQQYQPTLNSNAGASGGGGGSGGSAMGAMAKQLMVVGGGIAAAKVLTPKCSAIPSAPWACPMVAMSLMQAVMSGGSSGKSKASATQFSTSTGTTTTGLDGVDPNNPFANLADLTNGANGGAGGNANNPAMINANSQLGQIIGDYKEAKAILDKSGYSISEDGSTITGPDGKKTPTSMYSSPDAMKAAGFSDAQIQAMMDAQKAAGAKANDKIRAIAMAVEGGAGGGGSGAPTGGSGSGRGGGYGGGFNFKMPGQGGADKPKVSGLSKQLGNDKIGLASDDIFEMIKIRYDAREAAGNFVPQ